jgi:hypothetical protein
MSLLVDQLACRTQDVNAQSRPWNDGAALGLVAEKRPVSALEELEQAACRAPRGADRRIGRAIAGSRATRAPSCR